MLKKSMKMIAAILCMSLALTGCDKKKEAANSDAEQTSAPADKLKEDGTLDYGAYVKLSDYKNVSLNEAELENTLEETITSNIKSAKAFDKVEKGKVKKGDIVNINFEGTVDGKMFEGGSYPKEDYPDGYDLEIGANQAIDGFDEQLTGKKIGSKCTVKVTFPESSSNNQGAAIAGKDAVFKVTINFVKIYKKLDKAMVKKYFKDDIKAYNEKYNRKFPYTVKGYKSYLREGIIGDMMWSDVTGNSEILDYPHLLMEEMTSIGVTRITTYLKENNMELSDYLKNQNMTQEEFDSEMEKNAQPDVAKKLVCYAIGEAEGLTVTDEQYQEELKLYMKRFGQSTEDEFNKWCTEYYGTTGTNLIKDDLMLRQVLFFLADYYNSKKK